jgi:acetate---CoA ligase (ADP-forming)
MRSVTGAEQDVVRLFNPASVAVIGASSKVGSLSWWPLHLLATKGFAGNIYPINPARDTLEGLRCYPSLDAIGKPVDLAVIALDAERSLEAVRACAAVGVGAVVLPSQGFGETGEAGAAIQHEMAALARSKGMRIVGPNTDGIANLANGAIASIQPLFEEAIRPGPVGIVTQSGATASSLLLRLQQAGIGCSAYASTGNEADLGLTDYLSVLLQDPGIRIILSFVESLRRPEEFRRVADLAAELGKPIALIKVGRSEQGARRAAAHTGSLAGSDQLYDALFRSRGVIRVSELSELVAVAKLFLSQGAPRTAGVGIISVSGGQAGNLADKAGETGLPVPAIDAETEASLTDALRFGRGFNPCDLTGEIARRPELAAQVYEGFSRQPEIGTILYARKHLTASAGVAAGRMLGEASRRDGATPLAVYAMDGAIWGEEADAYREHGVPVFDNLNDCCTAIDRLASWSAYRSGRREAIALPPEPSGHRFAGVVPDGDAKRLLAQAQVRMPAERFAPDREAAAVAAEAIGFPVVLKVVSDHIPHKTEAGGVALDLQTPVAVREAFDRLMARARAYLGGGEADGVLVQEQVGGAVEAIVGIRVDPHLGPFVMVGLGGVFTELLQDAVVHPAPVDLDTARAMIGRLRGAIMLHGFRGQPARDVEALAQTIVDVSRFAAGQSDRLAEADLNPVMVLEKGKGVRAVDTLLVGRE